MMTKCSNICSHGAILTHATTGRQAKAEHIRPIPHSPRPAVAQEICHMPLENWGCSHLYSCGISEGQRFTLLGSHLVCRPVLALWEPLIHCGSITLGCS